MKTKRKTPEIRFRGFTDDWEQRKLKEVAEYKNGKAHENDVDIDGKVIIVNSKFVSTEGLVRKYTNKQIEPLFKNDIAFVLSDVPNGRAIAKAYLVEEDNKYSLNQRIAGINAKADISSTYLFYLMNRNSYFLRFDDGVKQTNLRRSDVEEWIDSYPVYEEQLNIGSLLKKLDNTITLHQRKLQQLKEVKRGMLLKMFPIGNTKTPSLRFLRFKNEWKNQKLKEVTNRFDNLRVPVTASDRIAGTIPYYGANGIQDYVEGYTHNGEYILVAEDGANDLRNYPVHYANGKIWVNNHAHVIQAKKNISNNRFLQYSFSTLNIEPFLVGGSRAKLNSDIMMNLILKVPSIEEQEEIGKFIQKLDQLIELQEREIELLEETKKGFLQKMFV